MQKYALIFALGGVGSIARYWLGGVVNRLPVHFPVGTLAVNVLGCLAIGYLTAAFAGWMHMREEHRIAILVGLLGGFTTFSTFGLETYTLFTQGRVLRALSYIAASITLGLLAVWLGHWLGSATAR